MKNIVLLFLLVTSQFSLGQNHKIAQLLNKQLQKEMTHFYNEKERENFTVTEAFRIDENNILHFGYTIKSYDGGKINVYSKIPLNKIINIGRDHNIYFETLDNDVTETQTHYEKNGQYPENKNRTNAFVYYRNKQRALPKPIYETPC